MAKKIIHSLHSHKGGLLKQDFKKLSIVFVGNLFDSSCVVWALRNDVLPTHVLSFHPFPSLLLVLSSLTLPCFIALSRVAIFPPFCSSFLCGHFFMGFESFISHL